MILVQTVTAFCHHDAILQTELCAKYVIELSLVAPLYDNQRRAKVLA
jgi:hypothetical protein